MWYTNDAGLEIRFWSACSEYVDIVHAPSGDRIGQSIRRTNTLGKVVHSAKAIIAIADKIAALTDWTKSKEEVCKACFADDYAIYKQVQALLPRDAS